MTPRAAEIHHFWFGVPPFRPRPQWFQKDDAFDAAVAVYADDVAAAAAGAYDGWADAADTALPLLLLLDQFPRNLFRGSARAYATDHKARGVAVRAVARGFDRDRAAVERWFFYLPFEHSEDLGDQRRAAQLFGGLRHDADSKTAIDFAAQHLALIERFGRFPGRNAALGRATTPEEQAWLDAHPDHF